jgi:hypothetical protein
MEAKELRIGNYVEGIGMEEPIRKILDSIGYNYKTEKYELDDIDIQYFKPIPLTDEWFEKFGFHKDGEYWCRGIYDYKYCFEYRDWAKNWAFYQEFTDSPHEHDNGVKYPISFDIEHVHQLQNLYFALQHEELKLK